MKIPHKFLRTPLLRFATILGFLASGTALLAQPALTVSPVSGQEGSYSLNEDVTFSFTINNTTPPAQGGDGIDPADVDAINQQNTARITEIVASMVGTDIYGNAIAVPASVSPGTASIAPGESLDFEGTFKIPNDGTLHNPPGNAISAEISFESGDVGSTGTITTGSPANVSITVVPNLAVTSIDIRPGTYRGGDILQFSVVVRNLEPSGTVLQTRPLVAGGDDHRTEFYLTDDASLDRNSDFRLGFVGATGSLLGLGPSLVDLPGGRSTVREVEVNFTPPVLDTFGRDYSPQPMDTYLDRGEELRMNVEVLIPRNFEGEYFIAAFADALDEIAETQEGVNASFGNQGDNIRVNSFTPDVRIVSSDDPTLEPVSERTDGDGTLLDQSDGTSDNASVSENGEWVVFDSLATNLDPDVPGNRNRQIYLRNTRSRDLSLISVSNTGVPGNRDSRNPVISADGRFVAYESAATNFTDIPAGRTQIFVYDRNTGRNKLVSVSAQGVPGNASSFLPSISSRGRFVAFESVATNLDPAFESALGNRPAKQVFVVDRDVTATGVFDSDGNTNVRLASVGADGSPAEKDVSFGRVNLSGEVIVMESASPFDGVYADVHTQIWFREMNPATGEWVSALQMASVNQSGVPGKGDSSDPVVNGGPSAEYGLQIAFVSKADNLVPDDTNEVADIFVRDFSDPTKPVTTRVSVSNPRVAYGRIHFTDPGVLGPGIAPNRPASQPEPGDTIKLDDGIHPAITFVFVNNSTSPAEVEIGLTAAITRDNLAAAINQMADFGNFNFFAFASNPPSALSGRDGFGPGVTLFNTVTGAHGNTTILVDSPNDKIEAFGMFGGGTEANDAQSASLADPKGSLQPSIDRSGRLVSFRTLASNLSVVREPNRFVRASGEPLSPGVGELIRPLYRGAGASNVYLRDRDLAGAGVLDLPDNTDTARVSVNPFGYPTNSLLNVASTGSSRRPALSADGRFVAFASDATNNGGLRFGRSNTQPLDTNNRRDIFIFDRNVPSDIGGGSIAPAFTTPMAPAVRTARNGQSIVFQSETTGVEPVRFQWRKDGVNLNDSARISGTATRELFISDLQPGDAGIYVVVAQNVFGAATSPTFELVIGSGSGGGADNLIIDRQPEAKQRPVGGVATFEVAASASGSISYQWMKDGVDLSDGARISGASTAQLQLFNLESADAGDYSVRVLSNGQGPLFSSPAALAVTAAPVITVQPQSLSLASGGTGQLEVAATSSRPLSYQWFKGGTPIPGASANALVIAQAAAIDAGSYSVRVSDDLGGQIMSAVVSVQVGGASGTSLPAPLQAASSLGSDWYKLPWFGSFAAPGGPGSNWIYRNDLGWLFVAPAGSANGFWFWSHALSSWMWTSQSAAGNGFYYQWSDADWVFIQPQSSGFGAWIKSTQTGDWTSLNP